MILNSLEVELYKLADDFISKHEDLGMKATGDWIDSVEVVMNAKGGKILANDYTEWLVQGRPPNKNSSEEEIRKWAVGFGSEGGKIYEWAKAKNINISPIAIAYSIARNGTKSYPEGTDLIDGVHTDQREDEILEAVGESIIQITNKILIRDLEKMSV